MAIVTIYDIAQALNTSATTVSRALQGKPGVSKKMVAQIIEMARKMGYTPNLTATNLRTRRSGNIGVLVPRLNSNFIIEVISGIEKTLREKGFRVLIMQSDEQFDREKEAAAALFESRVDGLIVSLASETSDYRHFNRFIDEGIPIVQFDRVSEQIGGTRIQVNDYQSAYELTRYLLTTGCQRLVHVTGDVTRNVYAERVRGFWEALAEVPDIFASAQVISSRLTIDDADRVFELLKAMSPQPDAVFTANDTMAVACMLRFVNAGIKVPASISFAGFNDTFEASLATPQLTTMRHPSFRMGQLAAQKIMEQIQTPESDIVNEVITLQTRLMIRQSTRTMHLNQI